MTILNKAEICTSQYSICVFTFAWYCLDKGKGRLDLLSYIEVNVHVGFIQPLQFSRVVHI